jgi:hypothetical protein
VALSLSRGHAMLTTSKGNNSCSTPNSEFKDL